MKDSHFDIFTYLKQIQGYIRFESEIKKKKLTSIYNTNYIRIRNASYKDLKEVWKCEFMKLLKLFNNDLKLINRKQEVEKRLYTLYKTQKANILYSFYLAIKIDGVREVKKRTPKSTFYRNIKELKKANIDFSQKYKIDLKENMIEFNPLEYKEVV